MSLQNRINASLENGLKEMIDACDDFPWKDKKAYANLMAQTYWYTRHTTRILGLAGVYFDHDREVLHHRFMKHAAEEKGHEKLAVSDIKNLGFEMSAFAESASTMALYQTQYYWIQHVDPSAIYGYILSLEAFAVKKCQWLYETCKDLHGEKTAMFWKVHADEDPDHVDKAIEHVSKLDDRYLSDIEVNLRQTACYYSMIYREIASSTKN